MGSRATPDSLSISVVIPVYNDPEGLADTVDSLLAADAGDGDEIIIADNGSSDGTRETARSYADDHPDRVAAVCEDQIQGSYAARNRGIDEAGGNILCFVDADMSVPRNYFDAVRKQFADGDVDYLACDVRLTASDTNLGSLYNCATGFPIRDYLQRGHYAPTCCLCIHRRVLEQIGPFDDRLESGGDMEFGKRAHDAGLRQRFAPEITLDHPARNRLRALLAKERRIGRGHAQLSHYHPRRFSLLRTLYLTPWKYLLPHNPVTFFRRCRDRSIDVGPATLLVLILWRIPRAWAGLLSYLGEARRLRNTEIATPEIESPR